MGRAIRQLHDEFGIACGFATNPPANETHLKKIADAQKAGEDRSGILKTPADVGKAAAPYASAPGGNRRGSDSAIIR